MSEFLTTYGLWLVIALIVLITVVYLLSGRKSSNDTSASDFARDKPADHAAPAATPTITTAPIADPVAPLPPLAVDPMPITPPPVAPLPETSPPVPPLPEAVIADAVVPTVTVPIAPATTTTSPDGSDDLLKLKGVGPKLAVLLTEIGVTRFAQIAEWTDTDLAAIDARLGNFKGRPVRNHWIDQAKYLAAGDIAGFEAKYGRL